MRIYLINRNGANAKAEYDKKTGKVVVLKGSVISKSISGGSFRSAKSVEKLRNSGCVKDYTLIMDVEFKSPSTAANFVTGSSTNGLLAWKTVDGKKLKDLLAKE